MPTRACLIVIVLINLISFCFAQVPKPSIDESEQKPLIPLALGNRWTFSTADVLPDGTLKSTGSSIEEIRGFLDFEVGRFYYVDSKDYGLWVRNTSHGNEEVIVAMDEETTRLKFDGKPTIFFKDPVEKGSSYLVDYQVDGMLVGVMTVTETDLKIRVPAGEFSCLKYEFYDNETKSLSSVYYLSRGVGVIKYEIYEEGQRTTVNELTKYEPADREIPDEQSPAEKSNQKTIMPIAIGNNWTYAVETFDRVGKPTLQDYSREMIRGVFQSKTGYVYYVDTNDSAYWTMNTSRGNEDVIIDLDEETFQLTIVDEPTLFYRYPAEVGTTYDWSSIGHSPEDVTSTMTVTAIDVEVKVPAGTFSCIKYESSDKETGLLESADYVSPGIGLVQVEYFDDDGGLIDKTVLVRYQISAKGP